ncbi:bifunctional glycosyltransferase family 2/GtrA family protein [Streptococcus gallolyticus]|nr:bifunctional glycosyltransferase family 2/GtrA family protein [Streptococcus gallolyticus]
MMSQSVVIVIPSYEPDERLLELLRNIREKENQAFDIVLVDDGSGVEFTSLFAEAQSKYACHLQRHTENRGKGRALKTAIAYILDNFPSTKGIVTIDSDGQHTYEDMMKCLAEFLQHPDSLVLGVRTFEKSVPLRSKFGNLLTRDVLGAMTGMNVSDTQTGLRVIPMSWLPKLLTVEGERYEFEMNMLLEAKENNIPIREVGIATIYLDENQSSHFDVIRDSIRIYKVFFKYIFSSLFSFLVDIVAFTILISLFNGLSFSAVTLASVLARAISSVVNFTLNHKLVFKKGKSNSVIKYFLLVVVQIILSSSLVTILGNALTILPIALVKIFVDGVLFFVSYFVQKHFIFSGGENEK